jgi:LPS-assembly protein
MTWDFYSEISRFQTSEPFAPEADRFHVESGFTLPLAIPAAFINSEVKLLHTYYDQEKLEYNPELDSNVSRTLPKLRIHGGINLEKSLDNKGYLQTLEPQLQYLYVGDEDQSNIGIYDTTNLQDDYNGLFRDRRYSGLDRIAKANQLSWGVTTRTLDASNRELFSFSLGRIFYFDDTNIDLVNEELLESDKSPLAAELFFQIDKRWQLSGDIQYDTENSVTDKSNIRLDYRQDDKHLVQLNHRYNRDVSGTSVEQMSLLASYAISKNWQFVGRQTHDLIRSRSLESYAGFQYESCCWSIRIAYSRHINTDLDEEDFFDDGREEFNSGIMIQFSLKGFSTQESDYGTQDMFESGIFGYKRPYFLNN